MGKLDVDADIQVFWESIPFNPALMGEEIKSTQWFLLNSVWVKYSSSDDFTIKVNMKRKGIPLTFPFDVKKEKPFAKFQLPTGQNCDEFTLSIEGLITTTNFEIQSIGVLWKPISVGMRG